MAFEILDTVSFLSVSLATGIVASWLLPTRRRALLLVLMVVWGLPIFSRNALTINSGVLNVLGYLVNFAVLPYLFWDAPRSHRIICAALVMLIEMISEAFFSLFLISLNIPLDRTLSSFTHITARFIGVAIVLAAGKLFAWIVAHTLRQQPRTGVTAPLRGNGSLAPADPARDLGKQDGVYLLFLFPQFCFLLVTSFVLVTSTAVVWEVYLTLVILALLCLAIDAIALASLRRHTRALAAQERAHALEDQLAVHTAAVRAMRAQTDRMARFRHDQRNHLQAVRGLIERGGAERARSYVAELKEGRL